MAQILVVDDDDAIRRVLRSYLERAGFTVADVADAASALELAVATPPPDAIVCDVLMPGMSGLDFYGELAARAPELSHRLVFLTGANREPTVHQRIEQLGVPLLGKLGDLSLVVDAVRLSLLKPVK
jgi:CheY-like chemotaxis protein